MIKMGGSFRGDTPRLTTLIRCELSDIAVCELLQDCNRQNNGLP